MDFDPYSQGRGNRSGSTWKAIAFIVIASLLLLNAFAIFVNSDAIREEACWTRAVAIGQGFAGNSNAANAGSLAQAILECEKEFRTNPEKGKGVST
jgi:hypothetical protein